MPRRRVSAQVVGKDFTEFFRVTRVVLDRGSRDVRAHMPVVSPDGVVGTVLHVAGDAVDVQLAVDAAFGVDVEDERTHARGFVRGTGDPARYALQGRDGRLARRGRDRRSARHERQGASGSRAGIPVARVTKVIKRELGRDQEVEATPTVDFSRLEDVLILVTPPRRGPRSRSPRERRDTAATEGEVACATPRSSRSGSRSSSCRRTSSASSAGFTCPASSPSPRPPAHPLHGRARVLARARRGGRVRPRLRDRPHRDRARSGSTRSRTSRLFVLARAAGVRLAAQTIMMQVAARASPSRSSRASMVLVLLAIFGRDA